MFLLHWRSASSYIPQGFLGTTFPKNGLQFHIDTVRAQGGPRRCSASLGCSDDTRDPSS